MRPQGAASRAGAAPPRRRDLSIGRALLVGGALLSVTAGASGQAAVTEESVQAAIDKAVRHVYSLANAVGCWDGPPPRESRQTALTYNWGGRTALALNALAAAGQQRDPRFRKALDWLLKQDLKGTYAVGLRLGLLSQLADLREHQPVLRRDAQVLIRGARTDRGGALWTYQPPPLEYTYSRYGTVQGDYSNTNYAVLGLWAASDRGLEVPAGIWRSLENAWAKGQTESGGWAYFPAAYLPGGNAQMDAVSGSMTTAGIASLFLVIDRHHAPGMGPGQFRSTPSYQAIQKGLEWMAKNFSASRNPGRTSWSSYYFYNCERVAAAAGLKYFGTHDWFRQIAATILSTQAANGGISLGSPARLVGGDTLVDTSYCLLFLAKGSAPVVFNKLQHAGDWDNQIGDFAAFTDWWARQAECPANWQVVNLDVPAEELTDSRVLCVTGTKPLSFTDEHKARLKRYVELGGLLVFLPDRPAPAFDESVARLLADLWPDLELQDLDLSSHPLGDQYERLDGRALRIRRLTGTPRELALLVQGSPPTSWQRRLYVSAKTDFVFGANLHLFANDRCSPRQMPSKLRRFAEVFRRDAPFAERSVALGRIQYGEAPTRWDPEPLAFERFGRLLAERNKVRLEVRTLRPQELADSGLKLAHLTGGRDPQLSSADRAALRAWIEGGGVLIADQAGGPPAVRRGSFDEAFRRMIEEWFGPRRLAALPPYHPLVKDLGRLAFRHVLGRGVARMEPRLEAVQVGQRIAVVYSPYDLTAALLGNPNPLAVGATDETAYEIMSRLLAHLPGGQP